MGQYKMLYTLGGVALLVGLYTLCTYIVGTLRENEGLKQTNEDLKKNNEQLNLKKQELEQQNKHYDQIINQQSQTICNINNQRFERPTEPSAVSPNRVSASNQALFRPTRRQPRRRQTAKPYQEKQKEDETDSQLDMN